MAHGKVSIRDVKCALQLIQLVLIRPHYSLLRFSYCPVLLNIMASTADTYIVLHKTLGVSLIARWPLIRPMSYISIHYPSFVHPLDLVS